MQECTLDVALRGGGRRRPAHPALGSSPTGANPRRFDQMAIAWYNHGALETMTGPAEAESA
jgi:hypothetical protein